MRGPSFGAKAGRRRMFTSLPLSGFEPINRSQGSGLGETFATQKAGWFMDVVKVKVLE